MQRRDFMAGVFLTAWSAGRPAWAVGFNESDAAQAVRVALERGAHAAVDLLGRADGYLGNPKVRIPLPKALDEAAKLLKMTGQQKKVDQLVTAMNRAAEAAVPQARTLLVNTAKSISVDDAIRIVKGGDTSVTDYFAGKTRAPLAEQFLPIVTRETEKLDLANQYNAVAGKAAQFGLLKGDEANVQRYVTVKSLDGLYLMIGEEERKIRKDPIGTGSAVLRKVFGG
ncbi:MAG: DUF4197 domain-containing protein [Burkholderiaceae bacterium]|nr:DUF4197 domain-containing protein [Burkholderiaceae bacterium]